MEVAQPLVRRLTPWILTLSLVFLTMMAINRVVSLRRELASQVRQQLEDDLNDRVASWETSLVDELSQMTEVAAADPNSALTVQLRMRQRRPYIDSLYLWEPSAELQTREGIQRVPGTMVFPRRAFEEDPRRLASIPCVRRARELASEPGVDALQLAAAYRSWCSREGLGVRIVALSEAMAALLDEDLFADVLEALDQEGLPPEMSVREAALRGVSPLRAIVLKFERAEALLGLGEREEAFDLVLQTGLEIAGLDAPDLANQLQWIEEAIRRLERNDETGRALRLRAEYARAIRRLSGYQEVVRSLLNRLPPQNAEQPRFIYDQYNDNTYLLFTRWAQGSQTGVALQLDQAALLEDFLDDARRFRNQLVVTDSSGKQYAGVRRAGEVAFEVPFSRTLPHLRVGLLQSAVDTRMSRLDKEWIVPALLAGMMLLLGFYALYEQIRASRQQRLLLQRQREFATRVTHELKTPLAGIKVMAENLELGLFKTDADREEMANAIVREADNLTARVNEILSVAKERTLRKPEPFDPEEALLEAVEVWGPRMEAAGVRFLADLAPTDEVNGDMEAIRDAVACLLDNALKYRRPDEDPPRVELTLDQEGRMIRIAVTDNGLGVPAGMRAEIFDRFVRVEGPNRGKAGGHGLGLAQVADIVKGHNGRARCEEGIDGGARFVLELPAHR